MSGPPWDFPDPVISLDTGANTPTRDRPEEARELTYSAIRAHGQMDLIIYTDGSVDGGIVDGGCGMVVTTGDPENPATIQTISIPGPPIAPATMWNVKQLLTASDCCRTTQAASHMLPTCWYARIVRAHWPSFSLSPNSVNPQLLTY